MFVSKIRFLAFSFLLGLAGLVFLFPQATLAATRTWDGGGTDGTCGGGAGDGNKWSCAANWSSDTAPVAGDVATFNGTSTKNATIDTAFTLVTMNINAGYTGTITQSADLTLVAGSFTHNTTDGNFIWTTGTLAFTGGSSTWDVDSGDDVFGAVTISKTTGTNLNVSTGDTAVVTSTLTLTDGNINTGTVEARGDVVHGTGFDGGTGTLNITQGSSDINLTGGGQLPAFNFSATRNLIGNATGTVTFDGNAAFTGGTFTGGSGNLDFNGTSTTVAVSIVSPASFTAPSGTMFINGGYSHVDSSTFTHNSGTVTLDGIASTINVNTTETFNNLTFNQNAAQTKTVSSGDTLIVLGTLTLVDGAIGTGTVDARGDVLHGAAFDGGVSSGNLTITSGTSDINLTAGGQLPRLTLSASRTINGNVSGTVTFDDFFTITAGSFVGAAGDIDVNGTFTLSGTGIFTAPSGTWFMSGAWIHTTGGTFNHNSGTVLFDGNQGMNVDVTETLYNLTINSTTGLSVTTGDTVITLGTLTLTNGTTQGYIEAWGDVVQAATFDGGVNTGSVGFGNDSLAQTYTVNGGVGPSVIFNAVADEDDELLFNATAEMRGITIQPGFTGTVPLSNPSDFVLTIETWNQQDGYYDASGQSHWLFNDIDCTGGTFIAPQLSTIYGVGNVNFSVNADPYFNDFTINKSTGTNYQIPAGSNLTIHGDFSLIDGGFASNNNAGKAIVEGNVTIASTYDGGSARIEFSGSGTQTLDLTGATSVFDQDIRVDKTGGSVSLISDLVMNASSQDLQIIEGTFDLAGHSLTVNGGSGTLTVEDGGVLERFGAETMTLNAGQPTLASGSTVRYTGDGDAVADTYTVTTLASTYGNLSIASTDGATDTFQLGAPIVLNGDFELTSGTFNVTTGNHSMLVHGDWSNSGTFNPQSGTVTFNGPDHELFGSTTFYNFTENTGSASTLTFPAGATQTFTHNLTLTGSGAGALSLRSSTPGVQAFIDPQGTRTLHFLNVQDNNNQNALVANCSAGCTDSGNNHNWFFVSSAGSSLVAPVNLSISVPACTATDAVQISLTGTNVGYYLLSEDPNFVGSSWTSFLPQTDKTMTVPFVLSLGDGTKTIYAAFKSSTGYQSATYLATVVLDERYACLAPPEQDESEAPAPSPTSSPTHYLSCSDKDQFIDDAGVFKAGSTLLKFAGKPEVYTIENDASDSSHRILRWLSDENTAVLNFGSRWSKYVLELPEMTSSYTVGEPITTKEHSGTVEDLHARAAITKAVSYELSIVTPDGVRRDGSSDYARRSTNSHGIGTYYFEDKTDFDYNDVVLMLDPTECLQYRITALPIEAKLHSQVWLKIFWEGQPEADILVFADSQDAVANIATVNSSNDILMNGQVKIEIKNGVNAQLFRPLSLIRHFLHRLLTFR